MRGFWPGAATTVLAGAVGAESLDGLPPEALEARRSPSGR